MPCMTNPSRLLIRLNFNINFSTLLTSRNIPLHVIHGTQDLESTTSPPTHKWIFNCQPSTSTPLLLSLVHNMPVLMTITPMEISHHSHMHIKHNLTKQLVLVLMVNLHPALKMLARKMDPNLHAPITYCNTVYLEHHQQLKICKVEWNELPGVSSSPLLLLPSKFKTGVALRNSPASVGLEPSSSPTTSPPSPILQPVAVGHPSSNPPRLFLCSRATRPPGLQETPTTTSLHNKFRLP